jgi:predicted Zn-dependent protease
LADSPTYYTRGSIEVWDFIRDQGLNYHLGCAIKYIARAGYKDSAEQDLKKAIHYLENELSHLTSTGNRVPLRLQRPEWGCSSEEAEVFDR